MARLFFMDAEGNAEPRCSVPGCGQRKPTLYDPYAELYFCDHDCVVDFVGENPETFAVQYAESRLQETD